MVETKNKYQQELNKRLEDAITNRVWKQDEQQQQRQQKERVAQEKILKQKLSAALKRQKKLDYERRRQDARFKKLKEQQTLSARLLSDDERN